MEGTGMLERLMAHIGDRSPEELRKEYEDFFKNVKRSNGMTLERFAEINNLNLSFPEKITCKVKFSGFEEIKIENQKMYKAPTNSGLSFYY